MRAYASRVAAILMIISSFILFSCSNNSPLSVPNHDVQKVQATETGQTYEGTLDSGALYKIWMPYDWNGELVVFAHGYVSPLEPIAIPEDQLTLDDGSYIPDLVTDLGYAFATTSYRENGLAVQEGIDDLAQLVNKFKDMFPDPNYTYLVGGSEGGLITIKSSEMKRLYSGGLALCGPIGDFTKQVDYVGDFRVLFDYFFPGILPGNPMNIPQELMDDWESVYVPKILQAFQTYPDRLQELIICARAAVDPNDPSTFVKTALTVLWYNVFATNDLVARVGGNPYDNTQKVYHGSADDAYLNKNVQRISADPAALQKLHELYDTTGKLNVPVITMHTVADPIVPAWHERLYRKKALSQMPKIYYDNIFVMRYGHCNFTKDEVLDGFEKLVLKVKAMDAFQIPTPLSLKN